MNKNILALSILIFCNTQLNAQQTVSLEDCRRMAIENNKDLKIRKTQIEIAGEMKKVAFTYYLPNFSGMGSYIYNSENVSLLSSDKFAPVGTIMPDGSFGFTPDQINNKWTQVNGNPVPLDANNQPFDPKANPEKINWKGYAYLPKDAFTVKENHIFMASLMMTQPIYMGGKIRELNKMAGYAERVAREKHNAALSDILYSVDEAYWQVVSVSNKLKLALRFQELVKRLNDDVTEAMNEGVATQSDVLKVKVKLNEAELNIIKAENGLNLSKMVLCRIIGLPMDSNISLSDEEIKPEEVKAMLVSSTLDEVYENRPEIKMLQQAINVSESEIKLKRSEFLPNLGLTAGYAWMSPNPYNGFEKEFKGAWNVGVMLKVPIFHWGERVHKLNASKAEHRISQFQMEDAKEKIELQVLQSKYKIDEAVRRLGMTHKNVESAVENLMFACEGYKEGVITLSDFMAAQVAWQSANLEQIDSAIEVMLCNTYLLKATGNLK